MSNKQPSTPVRISVEGLNRRSLEAFASLLKRRCSGRVALSVPADAQVTVFNRDCADADARWSAFRAAYPERPVVIVARKPPPEQTCEYVPVPINLALLEAALNRAIEDAGRPGRRLSPTAQRRAQVHPAIDGEVFYRPGDYFIGPLLAALGEHPGEAVKLTWEGSLLLADRGLGRIYTDVPADPWPLLAEPMAGRPGPEARVLERGAVASLTARRSRLRILALEPFVWELAARSARGRVPEGTALDEPAYLRRWPNFTRLAPIPHALRVAALWVQEPRSLLDLCSSLQVPLADTFTFYAAAHSTGLAGPARREIDRLIEPSPVPRESGASAFGAALGRLANRLRGAGR